jgi:hypothetical protein
MFFMAGITLVLAPLFLWLEAAGVCLPGAGEWWLLGHFPAL